MAGAHDQCRAARIEMTVASEDIRYAVGNAVSKFHLTFGRQAARTERVRRLPGAGRIDHGTSAVPARALGGLDQKQERPRLSRLAQHLVGSPPGNGDNTGIGLDRRRQFGKLCQRREILVDDLIGGGKCLRLGHLPAVALEKFSGDRIDTIAPRREDPHMTPVQKVRTDPGTSLINLDRKAAADKLGGSRQADRSAADDGDREIAVGNHDAPSMLLVL